MGLWILRRFDYSEKDNPNHLVSVMSESGPIVMAYQYSSLIPTLDDIISLVSVATKSSLLGTVFPGPRLPYHISVDAIEVFEDCKILFASIGVTITYYPPPSAEETYYCQGPKYEDFCLHCRKSEKEAKRDGQTLLRCGRCRNALYCCKEHQKADWKKHKHFCV